MGYSVSGGTHPLTIEYLVCKAMHWDRATYRNQPRSFIDSIIAHMSAESNYIKAKQQSDAARLVT